MKAPSVRMRSHSLQSAGARPAQAVPEPPDGGSSWHVLVIAELRTLRLGLRDLLRTNGCHVSVASGGHQAMLMARQQQPDVVVVSLPLPVLSAASTVQALRMEYGSELPVMALTPPGRRALARELRPCCVFELPFQVQQLAQGLERHPARAAGKRLLVRRQGPRAVSRR